MQPTQDGSSYGSQGLARFVGPNVAAKKGASAIVIRSIGTDHGRGPHAGDHQFRTRRHADPGRGAFGCRCRESRAHGEARQARHAPPAADAATGRHARVGQCRRRGARYRSLGRDRADRRPSRQLGSRHRRDRRRRGRRDHRCRGEADDGFRQAPPYDPRRLVRRRGKRRLRGHRLCQGARRRAPCDRQRVGFRRGSRLALRDQSAREREGDRGPSRRGARADRHRRAEPASPATAPMSGQR